jgi:xylose isomerase
VFWGGREGYVSLINTDMKQEREQLARFLHLAVDYAKQIGFKGKFFIEPKPKEPSTHQYDFDAATVLGFLQGIRPDRVLPAQCRGQPRHARHPFLRARPATASAAGMLGSLDINRGDTTVGWDTDQFPTDLTPRRHGPC